ncbi:HdeD family acid-resistance protein [Tsukamurella sp. 1534]|uniref:HdeD family acid-resistance protein n=1 Tax=Tsukamurella sp. 1534 TaxID=1151061 RepID=UPI0002D7D702|nr:DUF308 domain-containing protein [Tsukamurella sp. 1534]
MTDSSVPPAASQPPAPQHTQAHHAQLPILDKIQGFTKEVFDRSAKAAFGIGVVALILAIVLFAWPSVTLTVVGYVFAIYLLVTGCIQVFSTFGGALQPATGWWRFLSFVSGALSITLSVAAFRNVAASLVILAIFIGVGWLFAGITALAIWLDMPKGTPGKVWGVILAGLIIAAGVIVTVYPAEEVGELALIAGIMLIVVGVGEIFHGFQIRSTYNKVVPQV